MPPTDASASADELFGTPPIAGLATFPAIVTADEESELIARLDEAGLMPFRFQGWTGRRLTASLGSRYDFQTGRLDEADPIPDWLDPLRRRVAAAIGLETGELAQALLIRYDPGAGIGWHRDRPVYEHVVGVSLGAPATMRFRRRAGGRFERVGVALRPRAGYHLSGEVRHGWEHSIAAMDATRWSITFRSLSGRGEAAMARIG